MSGGVELPPRCRPWPPRRATHGGRAHVQTWAREASQDRREVAGACDTRTEPRHGGRNPEQGYQPASAHKHLRSW
jgi:hypothetical protein